MTLGSPGPLFMASKLLPQMLLESFGTVVYTLDLFLIFFNSSRCTVFSWTGVPLVRHSYSLWVDCLMWGKWMAYSSSCTIAHQGWWEPVLSAP